MEFAPDDALLVVDPQNDFMPGGALAVPSGDDIFTIVNRMAAVAPLVIASQDWHPLDHVSFIGQGGPWPPHCVQKSVGADFSFKLDQARLEIVIRKGFDPAREQYSCFDQTGLAKMLKARGVKRLFITGVATDYCVLWSTLGALEGGLRAVVVKDAVAGVEVKPNDVAAAFRKMSEAGAQVISSAAL